MKQVIWIRTEEKFVEEVKKILLSLIQEDESLAGEIGVKIFAADTTQSYKLSHIYDLSECVVNVLKERFGDDNVKFVSCDQNEQISQDEKDDDFMYRIADVCHRLELLHRRGFETKEGLMALVLVELEDINASLGEPEYGIATSLSILADCVSDRNTFCTSTDVTGEIGTY